jgi:hypothetical protein
MTISTQTSKAAFSGNGVSAVFPLPFPFRREADIRAVLRRGGAETPLTQGEHYALSGAGAASGGSLTMLTPPATGETLVAWRAPALVQEVDYVENAAFPAETHEAALDHLTMICQCLQEQLDRAVLYPVSTPEEDVLDSGAFLSATASNRTAARASEQNAGTSAAQSAASAASASASAAAAAQSAASAESVAAGLDGSVKVSATDGTARSLSAKLLAGNGLAEGIENPGGNETLRLSVALAEAPGLEFSAGLLRVKAGAGLALSASGLAADVGATAGKLVQLDASGRLPALDGRNLTNLPGGGASDLAAMNAFVAFLGAGRGTSPVPGGGIWLLATDELSKVGATYDSANKRYSNTVTLGSNLVPAMSANSQSGFTASASSVYSNSATYEAYRAFDLSDTNKWLAAASTGTLTLVFDTTRNIGGVTMKCDSETNRAPRDFSIEVNNGATWVTVYTASGVTWTASETKQFTFAAMNATALRVVVTGIAGDYVGINGLGVLPVSSVSNMTLAAAAGVSLGFTPTKASIYVLHKSVSTLTYNTDVTVGVSRGGNYATASDLAKLCVYDATYDLLKATMDLSAIGAGQTGYWRLDTFNTKQQQVRAALVLFQ